MSDDIETVKAKLKQALPHFRLAMQTAKEKAGEGGKVGLGVIAMPADNQLGHITARFEAPEFFEDIATLIGAGPDTEDEKLDAKAEQFLQVHGLKRAPDTSPTASKETNG